MSRQMMINEGRALQKLQQNPKKVLENAKRGLTQDLVDLANFWAHMGPELLELDVLSVFFAHLDGTVAPASKRTSTSAPARGSPAIDRAWVSLVALTKVGSVTIPPYPRISIDKVEKKLIAGWEGTFKWCSFFYGERIAPVAVSARTTSPPTVAPELRRAAMDIIAAVFYSLSRSEAVHHVMVKSAGSVEMATRLWVLEDECPVPSSQDIPVCSAALDSFLTVPNSYTKEIPADELGPKDTKQLEEENRLDKQAVKRGDEIRSLLDRVVSAAGGSPSSIVHHLLIRLKDTIHGTGIQEARCPIYLDLMGHLSRVANHQLRLGFLSEGVTTMVTKLAVRIAGMLERSVGADGMGARAPPRIRFPGATSNIHTAQPGLSPKDDHLLGGLVASLGYLSNTLESTDGFSWVSQSLSAGLLKAWVGAAHIMKYMDPEDADMIVSIVGTLLVRYLVYRSVVFSVKSAAARVREARAAASEIASRADGENANWDLKGLQERKGVDDELQMNKWTPEAREAWRRFEHLSIERYLVTIHMKVVKSKAVTCDNVKCQKVDERNNFMRCSSCSNTMYCSRECQIVAWKEGGHKLVCRLKQQEMREGRFQSISEGDAAYFHHLAARDARHHLPLLRRLASTSYPSLSLTDLVISIDYLKYPPKFTVYPLAEHEKYSPRISSDTSVNAEARNEELINRARHHPGKYGIIQSRIANGQGMQMILSVVTGNFWNDHKPGENDAFNEEWEAEIGKEKARKGTGGASGRRKPKIGDVNSNDSHDDDDLRSTNLDGVDMMMTRLALNGLLKSMGQPERF